MPHLKENSPANITWTGFLKGEALRNAFLDSRMVVVPSRCYEGFPNTIVQAMQLERSVVAVDLGSSGSIVQEGITGEKFRPMDVEDLIRKVASLYNDLERCQHYGKAGRREALRLYSRESIYERLMNIYEIATKNAGTK